jgi:integrase
VGAKNRLGVRIEDRGGRMILVIDFRYRDRDGRERRYRRDASVQLRAAAAAEAQRLKRLGAERGSLEPEPAPLTFAEFVRGDFARLVLPRLKPSTRQGYLNLLHAPARGLLAHLGSRRLDSIGASDVRGIETDVLSRGARPRYAIVCLRTVLRSALELGALSHAPRLPKLPPRSEKLPEAPPRPLIERLLTEARGSLLVAIAIAALAGLRSGEVRALVVGDISLDEQRLRVRRALSAEVTSDPKGRDERVIPMTPLLVALLEPALAGRRKTELVMRNACGLAWTGSALGRCWRRLQRRLGIEPPWHFHQLRHFFATELLRGGAHLEAVRRLLGHKDLAATARYLHASGLDLVSAIAALPAHARVGPEGPCAPRATG